MKDKKKKYIWFFNVICFVTIVCFISLSYISKFAAYKWYGGISLFLRIAIILEAVLLIVYLGVWIIIIISRGFYNIRECDDVLFKEIDKYKKHLKEDNYFYFKYIQIINVYYKKDGEVDELVKNKNIERLYARYDFLQVQESLYSDIMTLFNSLVISVISSFFSHIVGGENLVYMILWGIVIVMSFATIMLFQYYKRGQDGSYQYKVNEYEISLLNKKIRKLEKSLKLNPQDEKYLETKQVVLNELIKKYSKICTKDKKSLKIDIQQISLLDLSVKKYNPKDYSESELNINGAPIYLAYKSNKYIKNHGLGERYLLNKDFVILYQMLNKYNLVKKFSC